jgi:hypothetical protein
MVSLAAEALGTLLAGNGNESRTQTAEHIRLGGGGGGDMTGPEWRQQKERWGRTAVKEIELFD